MISINYMDNIENVQKRQNKYILAIRTMCPEELLQPDVSFYIIKWEYLGISN
jgi:hypothetical protein